MRRILQLALPILLLAGGNLAAEETEADRRAAALAAIREVAAARDLPAINVKIADARKLQGEPKYDMELARLEELTTYSSRFWEHVDNVLKGIDDVKELMVGEQLVAIVEYANGTLVLRVAGQNRSYTKKEMPAKLVLTLGQQELTPDDAGNKVHFGAFLALDGKGDKKLARQLWDEAAKTGLNLERLYPELDVPAVPISAALPPMNTFLRNMLSEKNWTLRRKSAKGWTKAANAEVVTQNQDGRLVAQCAKTETGPVQCVTKRTLAGDFSCRLIVQAKDKASTIGLFASDGDDVGYTALLPAGTYLVEISRVQGKLSLRVGERDIEPTVVGTPAMRFVGVIGLQVPPGSEATIAAVEFSGK